MPVLPEVSMRKALSMAALLAFSLTGPALAQTWTGQISDSICGRSHKAMAEHGGKMMSDADCTRACVKNGSKYVLVVGGKIYDIQNQDFPGLEEHAGHTVQVTGELSGDSIKASSISMAEKSKGSS
jgi:hypothetical protein